jgi:hypothetical protein
MIWTAQNMHHVLGIIVKTRQNKTKKTVHTYKHTLHITKEITAKIEP